MVDLAGGFVVEWWGRKEGGEMDEIKFSERKRDWRYWVGMVFLAIGAVMTVVGIVGNFVAMDSAFGFISLFSFVTSDWSFWVFLVGVIILAALYVVYKSSKKNAEK